MWIGDEMAIQIADSGDMHTLASNVGPGRDLHQGVVDSLMVDSTGEENSLRNVLDSADSWPESHRAKRTASRIEWRNYF